MLSRFFGPDYVHRQLQKPPAALFDVAIYPAVGPLQVDRVIELAARIASLSKQPRFGALRKEASRDAQEDYFAHLQALLAVAAPLAMDGWTLDLRPRNPTADGQRPTGGRAPDLRTVRDGVAFAVEVKRLGEDDELRSVDQFTDRLRALHRSLEDELGHALTVICDIVCDTDELGIWADQVRQASAQGVQVISGPGGGRTELDFDAVNGALTGPLMTGDLWGRLALQLHNAARQLRYDSRGWVLLQDTGSLAWATFSSSKALADKLHDVVSNVRSELRQLPQLAGAVLTTGLRNVAGPVADEDVPGLGCVALRRGFVGSRVRETFLVQRSALYGSGRGLSAYLSHPDARAMYAAYSDEPRWLSVFLAANGLPTL